MISSRVAFLALVLGLLAPLDFASAGQDEWTDVVSTGSTIWSVVVNPGNPDIMYVGAEGTGVFKSTDAGLSWMQVNNGLTLPAVISLHINPDNPNTLYAATSSVGVFKTTDGGGIWTAVNNGLTQTFLRSMVMHPEDPNILYVGTYGAGGGVFKSTNGGQSWAAADQGIEGLTINALAIAASSPETIYAGSDFWGIYKSTNGGGDWVKVSDGLPLNGTANEEVHSLAVDPSDANIVYAGMEDALWKTTNGGGNWAAANDNLNGVVVKSLAIDPATPATLYAGASIGGVLKSTNRAQNWTAINNGLTDDNVNTVTIHPFNRNKIFAGTFGAIATVFELTQSGSQSSLFQINPGLNDAWFDPITDGQGFFVNVFPNAGIVLVSWFTYEVERPDESIGAQLGEPGHRWLTAQGPYADNEAVLDVWITEGGVFDSPEPKVERERDGTIILEFSGCNTGLVTYDIPSIGRQGSVPIQRIATDNVPICESFQ